MELWLTLLVLGLFSVLAFWKINIILFMLSGVVALFLGFYWFDTYVTNLSLAVSLAIIAYAFLCIGMAFRLIFWHEEVE